MTSIRCAFQFARDNEFRGYKFRLLLLASLRKLGEQTRERSSLYTFSRDMERRVVLKRKNADSKVSKIT